MKTNRLVQMTVFFFLIIIISLCVTTPIMAKGKTIRIGFIAALTGFASSSERVHLQGAEIFRDWINEQGGIDIKGEKYLIELVPADHMSTADGAAAAANKLVYDEKVKFIAGGIMPFTVAAVTTVTEPAGVVRSLIYNCGTPQEFGANTPYTFLAQNGTIGAIISGLAWLKKEFPETKTISCLIPDDGMIPYVAPIVEKWAKINGMELKGEIIGWALDTVDFTPIALKAAKQDADAVTNVNGWPAMIGGILKGLRENGYDRPLVGLHYTQPEDVLKITGKAAGDKYYIHGLSLEDPELPEMIRMIHKRGKEKYGHERITYLTEGFDTMWILAQAIEKAQSLKPKDVVKAWESMGTMKSAFGPAQICGKETYGLNHAVVGPRYMTGLEKGEVKRFGWIRDIEVP